MIIFAFPGTGKTSLAQKDKNFVDLELSEIKYNNSSVSHLTKEERKSLKRPLRSKDYKQVYTDRALALHKQGKTVLAALNFLPRILKQMRKAGDSDFHIYIPKSSLRKEYLQRYQQRGNNKRFIAEVMVIWYPTLLSLTLASHLWPDKISLLSSGQVLEDFMER
ncbi:hypothetical protein [Streptococcus loxodontisalivarius]|uniref:ATP-binding protein n=1 Tax=Streptococcus loxodontisalivarius TaxID=1349415 RepID=A0ABS2PS51_9STRE|nr:hypothetical protein [Streptococcus loxodontisalivarius]MBM7642869.1 hypothetical protein [Streptococcus loxodontisalivarius]